MTSAPLNPIQAQAHRRAQRRSLMWRIHFWAALIASPFAVVAAITGTLYVFTPQIESALYAHLDQVEVLEKARPFDELVDAARSAAPHGWTLHSVVPAQRVNESARFAWMAPREHAVKPHPAPAATGHSGHGEHGAAEPVAKPDKPAFLRPSFGLPNKSLVVYVNPYNAQVLGSLEQSQRFSVWARKLHSSWLQGDGWRWIIELAASWVMVMLVTGAYLWWPQPHATPVRGAGRAAWRRWHAWTGVGLSVVTAAILATGLTWSKNAGERVRWLRDAAGQASPRIPAHFQSKPVEGHAPMNWEQAVQAIRQHAPQVSMQIMPPQGPAGVWRANHIERGQPMDRFDLLVDAYSGERLFYSGWDAQTFFGKATGVGIPFHRAELGYWNQAVLLIFGLGLIFSMVSGWVMYVKRRAMGSVGLPTLLPGAWRSPSWGMWLSAAFMLWAMPLLTMTAPMVALVEVFKSWRSKALVKVG